DLYRSRQLVAERLAGVLPEGVTADLAPIATGLGEIYYVFVESDRHSLMERREILDWQVRPRLRTVPGLVEVNTFGGQVRQYQVHADPGRMRAHGVTLGQLKSALEENNRNAGGGWVPLRDEQQVVQGVGAVQDL